MANRERRRSMAKDQKEMPNQMKTTMVGFHRSFSGPLPSPEMLVQYDKVIPNGAERFMQMAEKQNEIRHEYEKKSLDYSIKKDERGQWMGFCIALLFVIGSFISILSGYGTEGLISLGGVLVTVVGYFVVGKYGKKDDNE